MDLSTCEYLSNAPPSLWSSIPLGGSAAGGRNRACFTPKSEKWTPLCLFTVQWLWISVSWKKRWGSGAYGRLGHGDESSLNLPRKNELLMGTRIVDVSVGGFHMVALDDEGGVYSWGRGAAAGHGSYDTVFVPKKLDALASIKVKVHSTPQQKSTQSDPECQQVP